MSARILYHETRTFDPGYPESSQFVRVELRQWKDGDHRDTIIEQTVVVDGATVADSTIVMPNRSDAAHIRAAIRAFDALVASHPWASNKPREVTS